MLAIFYPLVARVFENIVGHTSTVSRIADELREAAVAPTTLLIGPAYVGKGTVALEMARALTCTGGDPDVPWNCRCPSCRQQRHLLHPDTLLVGGRPFMQEIATAGEAMIRDDRTALRFLFTRAVRKLSRRFDHVLWEGDSQFLGKAEPILQQIDELVTPLEPERSGSADRAAVDAVVAACAKLVAVRVLENVPVDVIRRISSWAHMATTGPAKVAIIENVDLLNDSSRNALLKTLEEPPEGVHFVLTSRRRGAVMPTILSRARQFIFSERTSPETHAVISSIFRDQGAHADDLRTYLFGERGDRIRSIAAGLVDAAEAHREPAEAEIERFRSVAKEIGAPAAFRAVMEEVVAEADRRLRSDPDDGLRVRRTVQWRDRIAAGLERVESYNVDATTALEAVHRAMRRTA